MLMVAEVYVPEDNLPVANTNVNTISHRGIATFLENKFPREWNANISEVHSHVDSSLIKQHSPKPFDFGLFEGGAEGVSANTDNACFSIHHRRERSQNLNEGIGRPRCFNEGIVYYCMPSCNWFRTENEA